MKKLITALFLTLSLTACLEADINVTPTFDDISIATPTVTVFDAIKDGEPVNYEYGDGQFRCNDADLFVYQWDTNAVELNADSTSVTCTIDTYQIIQAHETTVQLISI